MQYFVKMMNVLLESHSRFLTSEEVGLRQITIGEANISFSPVIMYVHLRELLKH